MEQRLIDANALTAAIEDTPWYSLRNGCMVNGAKYDAGAWYKAADIFAALNNAPTVDAEPVKHGRWVEHTHFCYTSFGEPVAKLASTFVCSVCGRDEFYREPFCHCGAKMDEED